MKTSSLIILFAISFFLFLSNNTYSQIEWTYSNLNQGRSHFGVASLGTKVYFAGGMCSGYLRSSVEVYNSETGIIEIIGYLSKARAVPIGVSCGTKVIFAGGISLTGTFSEVDIYDTVTEEWTVEHLSVPRVTSGVSNGEIAIFAGGLTGAEWDQTPVVWYLTNVVDKYNCETGEWTTDTLSEARDCRQATVAGDLAFFAGGMNGPVSVSNRVDIYNFKTGEWSIDSLSVARGWTQAASVGNKAFFAGGVDNQNKMSSIIDIYDTSTSEWSIAHLSQARAFANNTCGATSGDKVYFAGGGNIDMIEMKWGGYKFNDIDIYDNFLNTWSTDKLVESRIEHAVGAAENHLVVAGGMGCMKSVEIDIIINVLDVNAVPDIYIYPNPANNVLRISNKTGMDIEQISIYDLLGQRVVHEKRNRNEIDITLLNHGIYTIELVIKGDKLVQTLVIE